MTRPLTIGERQKLRTAEQRQASRAKGTETRRANRLASERHQDYAEGYRDGHDKALQAAVNILKAVESDLPPSLWSRFLAWWRT